jgi:hypothetical protein
MERVGEVSGLKSFLAGANEELLTAKGSQSLRREALKVSRFSET